MAAPVDAASAATNITTAVDPWTVNLPTGISAGHLLMMFFRVPVGANPTITGWTQGFQDFTDASDDTTYVFWKLADGTEGSTVSVTWGSSQKGAATCHRVTGAASPNIIAPIRTTAIGTTANANPAAASLIASPNDYLIFCFLGQDGEGATFTSPSTYSTRVTANSGTTGAVTANCAVATCSKQLTAASAEDPGAWTSTAPNSGFCSLTITVRQPPPAVPTLLRTRPSSRALSRFLTAR